MVFNSTYNKDDLTKDDARTFMILRGIANSLDKNIVMEPDYPSLHESGRVPVLDMNVWLDQEGKIQTSFYKKPMSSPYVMMFRSAVSSRKKGLL